MWCIASNPREDPNHYLLLFLFSGLLGNRRTMEVFHLKQMGKDAKIRRVHVLGIYTSFSFSKKL